MEAKVFTQTIKDSAKKLPANIYAILLLYLVFGILCGERFLRFRNFMNIVEQCTILSVVAVASLLAIITRGIDLSLGAIISLSGVVAAQVVSNFGLPVHMGMMAAICAGMLIGMMNGFIISRNNIAPFIITLGVMNLANSLALIFSNNVTVPANISAFRVLGGTYLFDTIPYTVFVVIAVYVIFNVVTKNTKLGTYIYAVGGNELSASLTGINVRRVKFWVYTLNGMLAAVAGIMLSSRLGSAPPGQGEGYEFYGIASAVVGGASMTGGRGTVWKTLSGAFIISCLRNGLNMVGLPVSLQMITLGFVIIGVVTIDSLSSKEC